MSFSIDGILKKYNETIISCLCVCLVICRLIEFRFSFVFIFSCFLIISFKFCRGVFVCVGANVGERESLSSATLCKILLNHFLFDSSSAPPPHTHSYVGLYHDIPYLKKDKTEFKSDWYTIYRRGLDHPNIQIICRLPHIRFLPDWRQQLVDTLIFKFIFANGSTCCCHTFQFPAPPDCSTCVVLLESLPFCTCIFQKLQPFLFSLPPLFLL